MGNYEIKARNMDENRKDYSTWPCCSQLDEDVELSSRIGERRENTNHGVNYTGWPCCSQLDDDVRLN